jgi:hypothetical protein
MAVLRVSTAPCTALSLNLVRSGSSWCALTPLPRRSRKMMSGQHSSSSAALAVTRVWARCHWRRHVLQVQQQHMVLVKNRCTSARDS